MSKIALQDLACQPQVRLITIVLNSQLLFYPFTTIISVKNSFEFAIELNSLKFSELFFFSLANFDLKSLLINIPLDETIEFCVNECERLNLNPYNLKNSLSDFFSGMVKQSIFYFENQLYQQMDGVAIGYTVGPTLNNTFLVFMRSFGYQTVLLSLNLLNITAMLIFFLCFCNKYGNKFIAYLTKIQEHILFYRKYAQQSTSLP